MAHDRKRIVVNNCITLLFAFRNLFVLFIQINVSDSTHNDLFVYVVAPMIATTFGLNRSTDLLLHPIILIIFYIS